MKKLNHVGIDVSAKTFTTIVDHEGTRTEAFDLSNDAKGHRSLIRMITKKGRSAKVVLEATGVYSLDLALALHRAKRVEVMVANPRVIGQFAGATMRRSKTDSPRGSTPDLERDWATARRRNASLESRKWCTSNLKLNGGRSWRPAAP